MENKNLNPSVQQCVQTCVLLEEQVGTRPPPTARGKSYSNVHKDTVALQEVRVSVRAGRSRHEHGAD